MILSLLTWKVKLALLFALCTSLYLWHILEVESKVQEVTYELNQEYMESSYKLILKSNQKTQELKAKVQTIEKDKQDELKKASASYNNLRKWIASSRVRNNNNESTDSSPDTRSTSDSESTSNLDFGRLSQRNAEFLANYARATEELKIELLSCYKQYDQVKDTLDQFRAENAPRIDLKVSTSD